MATLCFSRTAKSSHRLVKVGVHAILDLLDANLAKKSRASKLAGRLTRRRDGAPGNG